MAKKAIKKVVKKAVKAKKPARAAKPAQPAAPTAVPPSLTAIPAPSDVFLTTPEAVTVPTNEVLLYVNGSNRGMRAVNNQTLGEFARAQAQSAGIRTFSIYVDDRKADVSMANLPLAGIAKIEIVAKDSRGSN